LPVHLFVLEKGFEGDLLRREVRPVNGAQSGMLQQSPGMGLEVVFLVGQGGELVSDSIGDHAHLLIMEMSFAPDHRHGLDDLPFTTEEMSQSLVVKSSFESSAPILDQRQEGIVKKIGSGSGDMKCLAIHRWISQLGEPLMAIHKLFADAFRPHVHNHAVRQIKQEQVVHGLAPMARDDGFSGFELKNALPMSENIELVGFAKGLVGNGDGPFEFDAVHPISELLFIHGFIEEPSEVVVDGIDMVQHIKSKLAELRLSWAKGGDGLVDGHF
jgi:hypothetical protein